MSKHTYASPDATPPAAEADAPLGMADYEALGRRLGRARLRQRLHTQVYAVAGETHQEGVLYKLSHLVDVDAFVSRSAKLSGMYGWGYRNFKNLRLTENRVSHPRLPSGMNGFRMLQLSDLHLDLDPSLVDVINAQLQGVDYDIAVLTGDFRNTTHADHGPSVEQMLKLFKAFDKPVYAILGNHDFIDIVPPLERAGMRFLLNEAIEIEAGGARFYLGGVDDAYFYKTDDLAGVRDLIPDEAFSVLLCHSPEPFRQAAYHGFDLMLSGHTHGGQICLPGGFALIKVCDVPRRLLSGAWDFRDMLGYTSVGTGSCGVPLRYFCPPEITLHILDNGS